MTDQLDQRLQVMDVHIVDILAHLEALLRHSHSIQRALLKLRKEAPPPLPALPDDVLHFLREHAQELGREASTLTEIIHDLRVVIESLPANSAASQIE